MVNQFWIKSDYKRRFLEAIQLQISLINSGYEILYFDEFSCISRRNILFNWGPIGEKAFLKNQESEFTMSFIIWFSCERFYGLVETDKTFDSDAIIKFVNDVAGYRLSQCELKDKKYVFVSGNAKIHTSKKIANYLIQKGITLITTVPYSPSLNPWEKMIGCVKAKQRSWMANGR